MCLLFNSRETTALKRERERESTDYEQTDGRVNGQMDGQQRQIESDRDTDRLTETAVVD